MRIRPNPTVTSQLAEAAVLDPFKAKLHRRAVLPKGNTGTGCAITPRIHCKINAPHGRGHAILQPLNEGPFRFLPLDRAVYGLRRFSRSAGLHGWVSISCQRSDDDNSSGNIAILRLSDRLCLFFEDMARRKNIDPRHSNADRRSSKSGSVAANQKEPGIAVGAGTTTAVEDWDF